MGDKLSSLRRALSERASFKQKKDNSSKEPSSSVSAQQQGLGEEKQSFSLENFWLGLTKIKHVHDFRFSNISDASREWKVDFTYLTFSLLLLLFSPVEKGSEQEIGDSLLGNCL